MKITHAQKKELLAILPEDAEVYAHSGFIFIAINGESDEFNTIEEATRAARRMNMNAEEANAEQSAHRDAQKHEAQERSKRQNTMNNTTQTTEQAQAKPRKYSITFAALCEEDQGQTAEGAGELQTEDRSTLNRHQRAALESLITQFGEDVTGSALHYVYQCEELHSAQRDARNESAAFTEEDASELKQLIKAIRVCSLEIYEMQIASDDQDAAQLHEERLNRATTQAAFITAHQADLNEIAQAAQIAEDAANEAHTANPTTTTKAALENAVQVNYDAITEQLNFDFDQRDGYHDTPSQSRDRFAEVANLKACQLSQIANELEAKADAARNEPTDPAARLYRGCQQLATAARLKANAARETANQLRKIANGQNDAKEQAPDAENNHVFRRDATAKDAPEPISPDAARILRKIEAVLINCPYLNGSEVHNRTNPGQAAKLIKEILFISFEDELKAAQNLPTI